MRSLRPSLASLSLSSICFLQLPSLLQASCFHPNGTQTTDLYHAPCSKNPSDPLSTICCAIERPNPSGGLSAAGSTNDVCLDNGLCMNQYRRDAADKTVSVAYYREECTERDWKGGKCLSVCVDEVCCSRAGGE
jgi:hypothetical protein